ncbi:MAG: hypothetical protein HY941_07760 [Gammaproteobacteria bacterium]|nr:hypothetical protein [Gammaproteobacteria bacterium]
MTERFFRLIVGALLLAFLYFDVHAAISGLIGVLVLEALSNYRVPLLISRLRSGRPEFGDSSELIPAAHYARIPFDAERAWRLSVAVMLAVTLYVFPEQLWFFPWFMGFAIFGAGLSGVCPVLISLKLVGFR